MTWKTAKDYSKLLRRRKTLKTLLHKFINGRATLAAGCGNVGEVVWTELQMLLLDNNLANHASSLVGLAVVSVCAWLGKLG